jgi:(E)-4-hydroxy-3-methylbut-2-enyl-diphosphate synthase
MDVENITPADLRTIGYTYDEPTDKWTIHDGAADYIYTGDSTISFALPGTLKVICEIRKNIIRFFSIPIILSMTSYRRS